MSFRNIDTSRWPSVEFLLRFESSLLETWESSPSAIDKESIERFRVETIHEFFEHFSKAIASVSSCVQLMQLIGTVGAQGKDRLTPLYDKAARVFGEGVEAQIACQVAWQLDYHFLYLLGEVGCGSVPLELALDWASGKPLPPPPPPKMGFLARLFGRNEI